MQGQAFFFCGRNILTAVVFVSQLSSNAGISVWRFVWVMTTNFRFMSDVEAPISQKKKSNSHFLSSFLRGLGNRLKCWPNVSTSQNSKCLEALRSQTSLPLSLLQFSQSFRLSDFIRLVPSCNQQTFIVCTNFPQPILYGQHVSTYFGPLQTFYRHKYWEYTVAVTVWNIWHLSFTFKYGTCCLSLLLYSPIVKIWRYLKH